MHVYSPPLKAFYLLTALLLVVCAYFMIHPLAGIPVAVFCGVLYRLLTFLTPREAIAVLFSPGVLFGNKK